MIDYKQIGLRIKRLREDETRKWSQQDIATKLDKKDKEIVRLYENGKSITLQIVEKLAVIFKVSEEFLLFGRTSDAKRGIEPPDGMQYDPRADRTALDFYYLNEPDKKSVYLEVKSKASANHVMLKQMIRKKLTPPPDTYVDKMLNHRQKRRNVDGRGT